MNKVQITPAIVGAMGTFYKKFDDDISKLGLMKYKFRVEEAQKIALLGTAHIIRRFFANSLVFIYDQTPIDSAKP